MTIGEAIRKARLDKGWTQSKLSMKAGIGKQNICNWEQGISFPSVINLIPVADALGVTLDELVGRKEQR